MKLSLIDMWERHAFPPLGLAYIASYVRKYSKHEVEIILYKEINKETIEKIKSSDVIAFTSVTSKYASVIKIAEEFRKYSTVPFIIGGAHISSMPQTLDKVFDIGVMGEGEETVLELLNTNFNKNCIGIVYNHNCEIIVNPSRPQIEALDTIPFPARDLLDSYYFKVPHDILDNKTFAIGTTIMTSRGCPYKCVYCQAAKLWKNTRYHSSDYVVAEIKFLVDTYNVKSINFIDDLCIANKQRLEEIVEKLETIGITKKVKFHMYGRANLLNDERFSLMKRMNVVQVSVGFETGSERMLKYLKGNSVTMEQNENVFNLSKKYNIPIGGQFIIGSPGEEKSDMYQTLDFIKKHKDNMTNVNLNIATPLPGTQLWEHSISKGLVSDNMDFSLLTIMPKDGDIRNNIYIGDIPFDEFSKIYMEFKMAVNSINYISPVNVLKHVSILDIIKAIMRPNRLKNYIKDTFRHHVERK